MSTDQSLEKAADRTPPIITTPEEYRGALLRWQANHMNVLTPFVNLSSLAPHHGLIASVIQLSPNKDDGDVYDNSGGLPWLKDGEVAPAKNGLRKIADCCGISTRTERTDPRTIPHYWEFKAIATYRGVDGAVIQREATMEWDLRDGSDRLKGFRPNQITEARKNGLRNCEARAVNAVIRECNGLKQKYTKAELAKPFVAVRVLFMPDMSDPDTRRLVTERALGGTAAMYPAPASVTAPAGEIIDAEAHTATDAPATSTDRSTETSPVTAPATDATSTASTLPKGFGLIQKIERKDVQKRGGGTFPKWTIVDHAGVEHVTTKAAIADGLKAAFDAKVPVDLESAENDYHELVIGQFFKLDQSQGSLLPDQSDL